MDVAVSLNLARPVAILLEIADWMRRRIQRKDAKTQSQNNTLNGHGQKNFTTKTQVMY
jgi:hypothetical protein